MSMHAYSMAAALGCLMSKDSPHHRACLLAQVGNDAHAVGELLCDEARDSEHRQPPVLQLLRLHLRELSTVRRLETCRIEADVARVVPIVNAVGEALRLLRRRPA